MGETDRELSLQYLSTSARQDDSQDDSDAHSKLLLTLPVFPILLHKFRNTSGFNFVHKYYSQFLIKWLNF